MEGCRVVIIQGCCLQDVIVSSTGVFKFDCQKGLLRESCKLSELIDRAGFEGALMVLGKDRNAIGES